MISCQYVKRKALKFKKTIFLRAYVKAFRASAGIADFCSSVLSRYYLRHKLRIRSRNSKGHDYRRWDIHPNWNTLFNMKFDRSYLCYKEKLILSFKNTYKNINKIVDQIAEFLVYHNPNYSKHELCNIFNSIILPNIENKVLLKKQSIHNTKEFLDEIKNRVLE